MQPQPTTKPAVQRLNVDLPKKAHTDLKTIAAQKGTKMGAIVVGLVMDFIEANRGLLPK